MISLLLRLYPQAWRDRYGDELRTLLMDTGLTPAVALDLICAGLTERLHGPRAATNGGMTMTIGSAWRHPSGWAAAALLVLAPTFLFVSMSMTYQLGLVGLATIMDPLSSWLQNTRFADLVLVAAPAIALALAAAPLLRFDLNSGSTGREFLVGIRFRTANVVVSSLALLVGGLLVGYFVGEAAV